MSIMALATLDLSDLTDDDIAIAASRYTAEANKRKIAACQRDQEQEWKRKKTLASMVCLVLGTGYRLSVWERDGNQRVYMDTAYSNGCVEYYHTGTDRYPPRQLNFKPPYALCKKPRERQAEAKLLILQICQMAVRAYVRLDRLDCDIAAAADVEIDPVPAEFTAFAAQS